MRKLKQISRLNNLVEQNIIEKFDYLTIKQTEIQLGLQEGLTTHINLTIKKDHLRVGSSQFNKDYALNNHLGQSGR